MRTFALVVALGVLPSSPHRAGRGVPSGEEFLRQMHDRYAARWFHTLTFAKKTTIWDSTGKTTVLTSYYSMEFPGKVRTDFTPLADGTGALTINDSTVFLRHGAVQGGRSAVNALAVLAFDVYAEPVGATVGRLKSAGDDLTKVHEETWQGAPVYVVGADSGDLSSLQFWIDAKRLVLVRLFTKPPAPNWPGLQDIQFQDYVPLDGGTIAPRVQFFLGAHLQRQEDCSHMKANVKPDPALFEVSRWMTAPNWARPTTG